MDANAASSRLLRANLIGDELSPLLSDAQNINLVRFISGPQELESLPERMVMFALLFSEGCEAYARSEYESGFEPLVSEKWPTLIPGWMADRFKLQGG